MPDLTKEEIDCLFTQLQEISMPDTINEEKESKALMMCEEYFNNKKSDIKTMIPLTLYFIIIKLNEDEQIKFIKENIKYIKEHDEEIFLYNMLYPKSLSHFLTFKVIKELKNIDNDIFKKIMNNSVESLFNLFEQCDYLNFFDLFYEEINLMNNSLFINSIAFHNKYLFNNIDSLTENMKLQKEYNIEFINFIIERYKNKISLFSSYQILSFIKQIEDINIYKKFIIDNYEKLNKAFYEIEESSLSYHLSETNLVKQEILISNFFDSIIKKRDIRNIINRIEPKIVITLYNKNKEIFNPLTLNDWIKYCSNFRILNDDFIMILDSFEISDIESLFDTKFYLNVFYKKDIEVLKYIETKYRKNIKTDGVIEKIDDKTSIFSSVYFKNLSEFKEMFKNKTISKKDENYKQHLSNFIMFLKNKNIINSIENNNFKEIDKLFYRIIMTSSITDLFKVSNIEEIALLNRLGKVDFKAEEFKVEQLEKYNVKLHKMLYKKIDENDLLISQYKTLILKLIFMIGYNNTKNLLEMEDDLTVLEHLIGNVDVKNVVLDEYGNPILITKLMNLLFSDKNHSKIKEMLSNKDSNLYKYFPRIFNEWEMIKINNMDKNLNTIINFLKSDEISLPPKYYRLEGLFKFIGCRNNIVNETLFLHDQMLNRINSTIPRIKGCKDKYSYEILKLDDMEGISVGNKTDCCFTVLGNAYCCLKHALTSLNGRILVIKKDNEIIAHSWIWRNGDLLCLDNIEISKKISCVDFFGVYIKVADEIITESLTKEGMDNCIKNITIGFTNFDKQIKGIDKYPCFISKKCDLDIKNFKDRLGKNRIFVDALPQPIEQVEYTDSNNVQYLIKGNGIFNLGESKFFYQDERNETMYYISSNYYEEDYINEMNKKINGLRYIKLEQENNLSLFKVIDVRGYEEVYCNNDWYIINANGNYETFMFPISNIAKEEINLVNKKSKILKKK